MSKTLIQSIEQFDELVKDKGTFLFFKNSTTCPISHAAYEEFENFVADHEEIPCYFLHVQEARPLSNYIAETFAVKHESPQALLFKDGEVVWNASHWKITYSSLQENVKA
jgi:bacillithiol system protein YtxJ